MNKKMNTNRNIFKLGVAVFFVALTMIAAACTNGNDVGPKNKDNNKTYTVTGTIELTDGNARSATTSFTRLDNLEYYLKAYKGTKEEHSTDYVVAQPGNGNLNFVFTLPEPGEWYIIATARFNAGEGRYVDVLSNSKEIEVKDQEEVFDFGTITLSVTGYNSETTGSINLWLYDHTNKVSRVSVSATALINEDYAKESTRELVKSNLVFSGTYKPGETDRTLNFTAEDIIPSCYDITFSFYGSNNKLLYSCTEAVTVFGGFVTDTWLQGTGGQSAHLVYDSYYNSSKFIITDELLESYNQSGDLNTPIILWNGQEQENVIIEGDKGIDGNGHDFYALLTEYTKGEFDYYETGTQVFGKIEEGMSFSESMEDLTNVFCIDNHTDPAVIYCLDSYNKQIFQFTQGYASYRRTDAVISLPVILNEDKLGEGNELDRIYPVIAYNNYYLYFFFKTITDYMYLGAIDLTTFDPETFDPDDPESVTCLLCSVDFITADAYITSMDVDTVQTSDGEGGWKNETILCFSSTNSSEFDNDVYIKGLKFEGGYLIFNDLSASVSIDPKKEELGITLPFEDFAELKVSDLQILNDVLYIALSMHSGRSAIYTDSYMENGGYYVKKPIILSNGGIAKIDLTEIRDSPVSFNKWQNNRIVLGWHEGTIYSSNTGDDPQIVALPPTSNDDDVYFYGVRKFVARKPDELVVADEGGYVDIDCDEDGNLLIGSVNSSAVKNRVVTINLATETFDVVDVDVSFDITFDSYNDIEESYYGSGFTGL